MPDDFDAYHQWLAIPPEEQPPDHYRLLGVQRFEKNDEVIEHAADRQMAHLRTFQAGKHSALSQRLLNEVAEARVCLLHPERRGEYDQQLREQLGLTGGGGRASSPAWSGSVEPAIDRSARFEEPALPNTMPLVIGGATLVVAVVGLAMWWATSGEPPDEKPVARAELRPPVEALPVEPSPAVESPKEEPSPVAAPAVEEAPQPESQPETPSPVPVASQEMEAQSPDRELPDEPMPPAEDVRPDETEPSEPGDTQPPAEPAPVEPQEVRAEKVPPPSLDEQKQLLATIDEVYETSVTGTRDARSELARRLLDEGRKSKANRSEQFVLLRRASELAGEAGEAELMLQAVDAIAEAGFDIPARKTKIRLLRTRLEQGDENDGTVISAFAAECVRLANERVEDEALEEVVELLDKAAVALNRAKQQSQSDYRNARVALSRARTVDDKAERVKMVKDAEGAVASLDAAISSVVDCSKGLEQIHREQQTLAVARDRLKVDPDDADACLTVGRWLCFDQNNWDEGLKLLARGSDDALKALAALEMAPDPTDADDRVARGDKWWELAEDADGPAKSAMQRRAARWYRQTLPDISGLAEVKVQRRLDEVDAFIAATTAGVPADLVRTEDLSGPWIDLLKNVDLKRDGLEGKWASEGSALAVSGWGRILFPQALDVDYDLEFEFMRRDSDDILFVMFPVGATACSLRLEKRESGLELIDHWWASSDSNPTRSGPTPIVNGQRHTMAVRVRTLDGIAAIEVRFDGRRYLRWVGPESALLPGHTPINPRFPGLAARDTVFYVVRARLAKAPSRQVASTTRPTAAADVSIVRAKYGSVDATALLQWALARDPFMGIQADHKYTGDPRPGWRKQFRVVFRQGAEEKTVNLQEWHVGAIPTFPDEGLPLPEASETLHILAARFGGGLRWADVTETVRRLVTDPSLPVELTKKQLGRDYSGKTFIIWFDYQGRRYVRKFGEGTCTLLPAEPDGEATASESACRDGTLPGALSAISSSGEQLAATPGLSGGVLDIFTRVH